jgi:DNA-binding IclR family transcriptional regulator
VTAVVRESQNSIGRMLGILDLFTVSAPVRPVADLIAYIGASRSTAYRYIKALQSAGLVEAVADGHLVLGPRIVELDRQIRQYDPMYAAGGTVLKELTAKSGHSALLCSLYSDSVMCIREEIAPRSPPNLFTRGQRRPLFVGAASKIILPYLPPHQLRKIHVKHARTIAIAGLGTSWKAFLKALAQMRHDGYVVTHGEFNDGVFGLSAPIFNRSRVILGSVGIAGAEARFSQARLADWSEQVKAGADRITARISSAGVGLDRPPRAVG